MRKIVQRTHFESKGMHDSDELWNELPAATRHDIANLALGDLLLRELREYERSLSRPKTMAAGRSFVFEPEA